MDGTPRAMADFATGFNKLLGVLRDLGIPHAVGGSLASSVHGSARTTVDIDIVARFDGARLDDFVARLETDFSLAPEAIFEAVRAGRPFNLIHVDSAYKFDLFPVPADPYYRQELERRLPAQLSLAGEVVSFPVVTAEDRFSQNSFGIAPAARFPNVNSMTLRGSSRSRKDALTTPTFSAGQATSALPTCSSP